MAQGGRVPDASAARLLTVAAALDLVVILVLAKLIAPLVDPHVPFIDPIWRVPALMGVMLPIAWFICEILLGGRTLGRFVLNMELCDEHGKPLPTGKKLSRGVRKVFTLGLTGMNPVKPARYDRQTGAVWHCGMVPREPRPLGEWQLLFKGGSHKGKQSSLARIGGFTERGEIRFGREKGWSNVVMSQDERVSNQHCMLIVHDGRLYLRDGNEQGKPSSNGTFLAGRKLRPGETRSVGRAPYFEIADVRVEIRR